MPHPLTEQIDRLTARLRRRGWLTGWSLLGVVAVGVAAGLVGFDYLTRWSDVGLRWLASGAWLAAIGWGAYRFLLKPSGAARRPAKGEVAHRVEDRFPSLGSRLTSSLAFLDQEADDPTAGSAELRRAVITETQSEAERIDFNELIDHGPLRRAAAGLGWLAAAVALATLLDSAAVATGVARLAAPWASVDWPRRNRLAFVDPPTRLARGQDFEATLVDENGAPPTDAQIEYRFETPAGRRTERRAPQLSGDQLLAMLENVQHPFAYRATGGDDHAMPWVRVDVVDPPSLASVTITAHPPAYTGLPSSEAGPDLRVLAGTSLTVEALSSTGLSAALLRVDDQSGLPLVLSDGDQPSATRLMIDGVDGGVWVAENDGERPLVASYRFHLEGADGIAGDTPPRRLRVDPDTPPSVVWEAPTSDRFVTAAAVVPIAVAAEDNLALKQVRVVVADGEAVGEPGDEQGDDPLSQTLVLFDGPESPPRRGDASLDGPADTQRAELDWDLAALDLPIGATLELTAEAEDYRPGVGRAASARRVVIISDEEFNQRVADAQSQLLRDLRQALEAERNARDKNRDLAAEAGRDDADRRKVLDQLATLGFDQRRVAELINDPQRGVATQAEQLLADLAMNRVERPALASQLERVADAARSLADRPLPEASRAVADAQRSAEADNRERLAESLAAADEQQSEVVDTLERLTDEMAGWSDLEQFAQELADLEQRQRKLVDATKADAAKTAAATRSPSQRRADRERLTASQAELARRFDKLMRAMQGRLEAAGGGDSSEQDRLAPVADTLAEADERATTGKLREASRQVREGRLGRAAEAQQQASEDLKELLSTLRNRAPTDLTELAKQLRDAEQRLAELQERVDELLSRADDNNRRRAAEQQRLAEQSERLGRRLDRLTADEAADSADAGSQQLSDAAQQSREQGGQQQQQKQRESTERAQEQLKLAEEQLKERIRQLENEAARRLLDQLASDVEAYLNKQRRLLEQTVELADNVAPASEEIAERSKPIAGRQRGLEEEVGDAAEKMAERKVFSLALGAAAGEMGSAAERLDTADPGQATQRHELAAIERLKHIADALAPTPPEDPLPGEQPPPGGQGGQPPPQKPPPFDVAELKMLRLMQLDLNDRTRRFEADAADNPDDPAKQESGRRLASEQRELADLVQELMSRNNKDSRLAPPTEVF